MYQKKEIHHIRNYHSTKGKILICKQIKPNYQVKFVIKLETNQIKHTFISENPILNIFKSSYYGKVRTKSCEIIYNL